MAIVIDDPGGRLAMQSTALANITNAHGAFACRVFRDVVHVVA
jgi:hypothetical protein